MYSILALWRDIIKSILRIHFYNLKFFINLHVELEDAIVVVTDIVNELVMTVILFLLYMPFSSTLATYTPLSEIATLLVLNENVWLLAVVVWV